MFRGQGTQQLGVHLRYVNEMSSSPAEVGMSQDGFRLGGWVKISLKTQVDVVLQGNGRSCWLLLRNLQQVTVLGKPHCLLYIYIYLEYCNFSSSFSTATRFTIMLSIAPGEALACLQVILFILLAGYYT